MFGMNQKMMETMLKSQLGKLKKVRVELEKDGKKNLFKIIDQNINQGSATLFLKEQNSGEKIKINFSL